MMLSAFLLTLLASTPRPHVAGSSLCTAATLTCDGTPQSGTFSSDSCVDVDGRTDHYQLFGLAGDEITVVLEGVDSTFTDPFIVLVPPDGDDTATPFVQSDDRTVSLKYALTSTGPWTIKVGSASTSGAGRYQVRAYCRPIGYGGNCEPQPATCNQQWSWAITPTSCGFGDNQAAYAPFSIHLDAGDKISLAVDSFDFDPGVLMWHVNANGDPFGSPVASNVSDEDAGAVYLEYRVKTSGPYQIAAYNSNYDSYGQFNLTIRCNTSCTTPVILAHPRSQTTTGGPVTLSVDVLGSGPFAYQWYQGQKGDTTHHVGGRTPTLQLDSVPATTSYWVQVTNACGTVASDLAVINVVPPGKRHAAGHSD